MLTIQLSDEIELRLNALASATGLTASFYAEHAIAEYLADVEDYHAAEREVEEVKAGRSIPVPLADVMKAHGVAD